MDSAQNTTKLQKELMPILLKLFCKLETEEPFTNSFYEATVTLILRLWKKPVSVQQRAPSLKASDYQMGKNLHQLYIW